MKPRVVAIIQARMGSSRLPGKVLLDIMGEPMLARVVARTRRAKTVDEVIVATTSDASDDPVVGYCDSRGIPYTRGSLYDVLDRYYQAASQFKADVVVRITADCPLIDPVLIDEVISVVVTSKQFDFVANRLPPPWGRTYPIGLDAEVCNFSALERAWKEAKKPQHREHVMPYFYENSQLRSDDLSRPAARTTEVVTTGRTFTCIYQSPRGFNIALLNHEPDYGSYRWTVDTPEDLEFIRQVYSRFHGRDDFSWKDVLALVQREPGLASINAEVKHKTLLDIDQRAE